MHRNSIINIDMYDAYVYEHNKELLKNQYSSLTLNTITQTASMIQF